MPTTPSARVQISASAGALAGGTGYCVVMACVRQHADMVPRVFSSWKNIVSFHDYNEGADYASLHIEKTQKPVLFIGLPIATPGVVGRQDASGVAGTCVITAVAGADGALDEVDAILQVETGGTIGTNGIVILLSLDGGRTWKRVRLGIANSYAIPFVAVTLHFAPGTLVAQDEYSFSTTAPMWDQDGIDGARLGLQAQQKLARSWMVIGDVATATVAGFVTAAINAYETSKRRFSFARINVRDRLPLAEMSRVTKRMTGTPTLTFLEVGGTGDTITRSTGSFIADGFAVGDIVTVAGSASNNVTGPVTAVSALVLTFGTTDLANEGPVAGCTITGSASLTFLEVGGTGDTITRSSGSWLDDGFRAGDDITIAGTASNNVEGVLTTVTATVLTFGSTDLANEVIRSDAVTITKGEEMSAWVADMDDEFSSVDGQKRIDIGLGRARVLSPISGWFFRRPAQWFISIREYQKDIHETTWAKKDDPLLDVSLEDEDGNVVEFDQEEDGGGVEGRFSCLRTWSNGPNGAFVAMSQTRDVEGSVLTLTHNLAVANIACTIIQAGTEKAVGRVLQKDAAGHATPSSLTKIEEAVNTDLSIALLQEKVPGAGPRASMAVWKASTNDDLSGPDATLTGAGKLVVNGTIVHVDTLLGVS